MSRAFPEVFISLNAVKPHKVIGKKCSGADRVILKQYHSMEIRDLC